MISISIIFIIRCSKLQVFYFEEAEKGLITTIFPAYAGVSPTEAAEDAAERNIPRVCGGEPLLFSVVSSLLRYSPRMRG